MNGITTRIDKRELLTVLEQNRENHRAIFLEAQEGFRKAVIDALEQRLKDARAGRQVDMYLHLAEPRDQTKDYDRVIRMLSMSQDDTIELDERDFAQYVLDDWDWKEQFLHANSVYSATARRLSAT